MFEGFETQRIAVTDAEIHLVRGGSGPPVLLVHGYPQNHVMWHKVAPALAERFTVIAAYVEAFTPDAIRGTCGDYRAGFFVDTQLDRADRDAGHRIRCETLVLWGDREGNRPSALDTWKKWADDVRGGPLPCGHFIPEEAPDALLTELLPFLGRPPR